MSTVLHTFCCRLCLHDGSIHQLFDIFSVMGLRKKVMDVFHVKIDVTDEFTTNICCSCFEETLNQLKLYQQYKEEHLKILSNQKVLAAKSKNSNCHDIGTSLQLSDRSLMVANKVLHSTNMLVNSPTTASCGEKTESTVGIPAPSSKNKKQLDKRNVISTSKQSITPDVGASKLDDLRSDMCNLPQCTISTKCKYPDKMFNENRTRKTVDVSLTYKQKRHTKRTKRLVNQSERETSTVAVVTDDSIAVQRAIVPKELSTDANANLHNSRFESSTHTVADAQVVDSHKASMNSTIAHQKGDSTIQCSNRGLTDNVPNTIIRQEQNPKNVPVNSGAVSESSDSVLVPTIVANVPFGQQNITNGNSAHYSSASYANSNLATVSLEPQLTVSPIAECNTSHCIPNQETITENQQRMVNTNITNQFQPAFSTSTNCGHSTIVHQKGETTVRCNNKALIDNVPNTIIRQELNPTNVPANSTATTESSDSVLVATIVANVPFGQQNIINGNSAQHSSASYANTILATETFHPFLNVSPIAEYVASNCVSNQETSAKNQQPTVNTNISNQLRPTFSSLTKRRHSTYIRVSSNLFDEPPEKAQFAMLKNNILLSNPAALNDPVPESMVKDPLALDNIVENTYNKLNKSVFNNTIGGSQITHNSGTNRTITINQTSLNADTRTRRCFMCNLCNRYYLATSGLRKHVRNIHNMVCTDSQYSTVFDENILQQLLARSRRKSVAAPETLGTSDTNRFID